MQKSLNSSVGRAVASAHLLNWGLWRAKGPTRMEGRKLSPEKMSAGKKLQFTENAKADGTREITTNHYLNGVSLNRRVGDYVQKNAKVVKKFVQLMMKLAPKMGIKVAQAVREELSNDWTETYMKGVRDSVEPQVQLVCGIRPTHRDARPRTSGDSELDQDDFRLDQDKIMTKTMATGGIETEGRTGKTTATGGIKTEGRTGRGDFKFGQDGFVIMADTRANRPQHSRSATIKYQAGTRMTSKKGRGR